eukprot:4285552-Prymnesium_polylepis.1
MSCAPAAPRPDERPERAPRPRRATAKPQGWISQITHTPQQHYSCRCQSRGMFSHLIHPDELGVRRRSVLWTPCIIFCALDDHTLARYRLPITDCFAV